MEKDASAWHTINMAKRKEIQVENMQEPESAESNSEESSSEDV